VEWYNGQAELIELMAEGRNVQRIFGAETSHKITAWNFENETCI